MLFIVESQYRLLGKIILTGFFGGGAALRREGGKLAVEIIALIEPEHLKAGGLFHLGSCGKFFPSAVACGIFCIQVTRAAPGQKLPSLVGVHPVNVSKRFVQMFCLAGNDKAEQNLCGIRELVADILVECGRYHIGHRELRVALTHGFVEEVDAAEVIDGDERIAVGHYVLPALGVDGQEVGQQQALFVKLVIKFKHFFEFGRSGAEGPLLGVIVIAKVAVVGDIQIIGSPGRCNHVHLVHGSGEGAESQRVTVRISFLQLDKDIIKFVLVGRHFQAQFFENIGTVQPAAAFGFFYPLLRELIQAAVGGQIVGGILLVLLVPGLEIRHFIKMIQNVNEGSLRRILLHSGIIRQKHQVRQFAGCHGQIQLFAEPAGIDSGHF